MSGKLIPFPGDLSSLPDELIPSIRYDEGVFWETAAQAGKEAGG